MAQVVRGMGRAMETMNLEQVNTCVLIYLILGC